MPRTADVPIPDFPQNPYPITTEFCDIVCGFGRGSSELGVPTANVLFEQVPKVVESLPLGVFFGFARLVQAKKGSKRTLRRPDGSHVDFNFGQSLSDEEMQVWPVVLSIGLNPFYQNDTKTVELHIIHKFGHDFYGAKVKFNILGYIRPELDYTTKEALIKDIKTDIKIATNTLAKPGYKAYNKL
ncbi:riboflavin kinase [Lachancea thermotolerans CBS 6340]|uniref:Riboflavin kinase n=1 Tax=Lachancea thermotolerans (strain ATCC 56472 / CBS 6340 / NRRL Y-8284) TaxID=559295 RepID=C5DI92_LACTC|nr:KLTH0E10670p [Lachancea thermotolerans CBS 6340]CAR23503.1 KLTH0E10670p [Lachancea thermotolerans CBS 6340]